MKSSIMAGTLLLRDTPVVLQHGLVGSASIEGTEPKDVDYLVLLEPSEFENIAQYAARTFPDFTGCLSEDSGYPDGGDHWCAIRNGDLNFLVSTDPEWYRRGLRANAVCRALKLASREDRVVVWRIVQDEEDLEFDAAAFV